MMEYRDLEREPPWVKPPAERVPLPPPPAAGDDQRAGRRLEELLPSPFRRRVDAPRRRRSRPWLRRLRRLAVLLAMLVPLAAAGLWALRSPTMALARLQVEGTSKVDQQWIEEQLRPVRRQNLLLLRLDPLQAALEAHPWVRSVGLRKEPPDLLIVAVEEHQSVACARFADGWFWLAESGEVITGCGAEPPADALQLEVAALLGPGEAWLGDTPQPVRLALSAVDELREVHPPWGERVATLRLLGEEDFELSIEGVRFALRMRPGSARERLDTLRQLLPQVASRYEVVETIDLRFERRIVLGGAELHPVTKGDGGGEMRASG